MSDPEMHFKLPPEPKAAKGYKPFPKCRPGDKNCKDGKKGDDNDFLGLGGSSIISLDSSSDSSSSEESSSGSSSSGKPCTENCDAEEDKPMLLKGPTVLSMPVGDTDNGMKPVKNTQTGDSESWVIVPQVPSCGCNVCPCPTHRRSHVLHHLVSKPACGCNTCPCPAPKAPSCGCTTCPCPSAYGASANNANIQAALAIANAPLLTASCGCSVCPCPSVVPIAATSCGCDVCPCTTVAMPCTPPLHPGCPGYMTAEEIRLHKLELYEQKVRAQRELERVQLSSQLENNSDALSKIEQMARAMKYQYAELRRHHMALRASVSANKQALGTLGQDQFKGTEFDIEGPMPRDIDDLDSVPDGGLDQSLVDSIQKSLNKQYAQNVQLLLKSQKQQRAALSDFLGTPTESTASESVKSESASLAKAIVSSILSESSK